MKFNNGNNASFYKVLPYDSADYLRLPPAFAKKYLEKNNIKKKQTVILKTKSGEKWRVGYLKMDDRYYLLDGWVKFMNDNHLQAFDFLVFWLVSRSPKLIFEVFCYATNGCLKHPTSTKYSSSNEMKVKKPFVEKETICDDDDDDDSSKDVLTRVMRKSYIRRLPLTWSFVKAAGIDGYCELQLVNDDGNTWHVKLKKWSQGRGQTGRFPFIAGWVDFLKDNNVKVGNRCDISHVKGNQLRVHVYKVKRQKSLRQEAKNQMN